MIFVIKHVTYILNHEEHDKNKIYRYYYTTV